MRKALAKSLLLIFEAVIDEIAERIKKRRRQNGNSNGIDRVYDCDAGDDLRDQSTHRNTLMASGRRIGRRRANSIFKEGRLRNERRKQI
jgi:hypothetical protein